MNEIKDSLSEKQLDFLGEMMNIGAGSAAVALGQLLNCDVRVAIPDVHILKIPKLPHILGDPSIPVVASKMKMLGDVNGILFVGCGNAKYLPAAGLKRGDQPVGATDEGSFSRQSGDILLSNIV